MGDIAANINTTARLEGNDAFGTFCGSFETASDHDWISVNLLAGQIYAIALSALETGSATDGDAVFSIRNSQGQVVTGNDDGGVGLNAFLLFVPAQNGTYYIDVSEHDGRTGDYGLVVESNISSSHQLTDGTDNHPGSPDGVILGGKGSDFIQMGSADSAYGEQGNDVIIGNGGGGLIRRHR
jgi:hypothetical protein